MFFGRAVAVATLLATTQQASADEQVNRVDPAYFFDLDATLFFWAPLVGTLVVDKYVEPRRTPLLFDEFEGGKTSLKSGEIPGAALTIGGIAVIGAISLGDDPARYHHAKGMAQSLATSGFVAVTAKRIFGRRRPDYNADTDTGDGRRSFPSGHSTRALSVLTYSALYLRYHGFDQWREPGTLPWWELASYLGLGAAAVFCTGERVVHHRHHVGDVVVGGVLGAASSAAFFYYNEHRYKKTARTEAVPTTRIVQDERAPRVSVLADGPMLSFGGSF